MKVIRAPLRVSLFGGGTDLDPYCSEYGSTIISFAIDKHIYLTWNDRHTGGCRLSYSEVEELDTLKDAQHTLVYEVARTHRIDEPCTLTIVSDLPEGTGLGSSSALAVTLTRLVQPGLHGNIHVLQAGLFERPHSHAGWQDYLPAVFGGFNVYRINGASMNIVDRYAIADVIRAPISPATTDIINRYGLLLYTGETREADSVLHSWQKSEHLLHEIKELADKVATEIDSITPDVLGGYLELTWHYKRAIPGVSGSLLDTQHDIALQSGALGGKLCGAGSGGCWFFLVDPTNRERVKDALGLREIPFQVSQKGVESWEL